jgi:hypothetical protein
MHSLTGHPIPAGHLSDRRTGYDLHDGVIALLHDAQLHEHGPTTPCRELRHGGTCPDGRCQASGEANVSTISRSRTAAISPVVTTSFTFFKGTPPARQPVRSRPGSYARTRSHRGNAKLAKGCHHKPGGGPGYSPTPGRRPARPSGREPYGRGPPPPRRCPAPAGRRSPPLRAYDDRARTSWPGRPPRAGHDHTVKDPAPIRRTGEETSTRAQDDGTTLAGLRWFHTASHAG